MRKYLIIISVLLGFTACPEDGGKILRFHNLSDAPIYMYYGYDANTIMPDKMKNLENILSDKSQRNSSFTINLDEFKDTLYISILSADTVAKYDWEIIKERNMILKRYSISLKDNDLKKIDYKVSYP